MTSRIILALGAALTAAGVAAQPASQQELEGCIAIERTIERLDCFERLTERGRAPAAVSVNEPVAPTPAPQPTSTPPRIAPATPPALPDPPATPAALEPTRVEARPQRDISDFGREQLPDARAPEAEAEPQTITATVNEVTEGARGNLYFHLDNGHVWRQIEARFVPYPRNQSFQVEISQGFLGEYRLRVGGSGRLVRIRRVQ